MLSADKWLLPATAASENEETIGYTYHQTHCNGFCTMKCTVRDGKLVKIEPNLWPDKTPSTICLKGLSEVQRVYSPERIKTPLKRVGERGKGKFVVISWDEALTIVADKLSSLKSQYGGKSIFFASSMEANFSFLPYLLGAQLNYYPAGIDIDTSGGFEPALGTFSAATATNEIRDWMNSKTILNLGSNILETGMTDAKWFFAAKEAGAKIITVDPYYSTTASHSNRRIPIRPGTDASLLLGMISCLLDNSWYQSDYLQKNTSAPFLVRADNQKLVRQNDSADGPDKNPFIVWDEISNGLKPYNSPGIIPKLEGEFTVDGVKVKTVFSTLKRKPKTIYSCLGCRNYGNTGARH